MIDWLSQPWPWWVTGPGIAMVMLLLLYFGKAFGISSTFRTTCAALGAGKSSSFFDFDWRMQIWNIVFALGALLGGVIAATLLADPEPIRIAPATAHALQDIGIESGPELLPAHIFSWSGLLSSSGLIFMVFGAFLVGFGARWAGGCTSGHGISGLSNLQWPSLLAILGFFTGGLIVTHILLPVIL